MVLIRRFKYKWVILKLFMHFKSSSPNVDSLFVVIVCNKMYKHFSPAGSSLTVKLTLTG